MNNKHIRHKETLNHINRIQGQIATLKKYIENDRSCEDISQLTTSIAKSFDALRARTLEGFILYDLLDKKQIEDKKLVVLKKLLNLHKK